MAELTEMVGLRRLCKQFGRIKIAGVMWVWDWVDDAPVKESEMPEGSERWQASEKKKWAQFKREFEAAQDHKS